MDPIDALELLERQYANNLLSREEFITRRAEIKMQMKISQDLARQGSRGRELYQLKGWRKQFRVKPKRAVDPERSAAAARRHREMWMRRRELPEMLAKARKIGLVTGGIPSILGTYAATTAYERYPEEEDIFAELEAIAGQKDDSRRKAIERAWIRNMFGRLANE